MSDPFFESRTPRLGLPLLFAGQAQKELHHNEALSRIDALFGCLIEGVANSPPASAQDGQTWIVGSTPSEAWSSHAGDLATRQSGQWLFQQPVDGLSVTDRATGQVLRFLSEWLAPVAPALPAGGSVVDAQARSTIAGIIDSLVVAGIFSDA